MGSLVVEVCNIGIMFSAFTTKYDATFAVYLIVIVLRDFEAIRYKPLIISAYLGIKYFIDNFTLTTPFSTSKPEVAAPLLTRGLVSTLVQVASYIEPRGRFRTGRD